MLEDKKSVVLKYVQFVVEYFCVSYKSRELVGPWCDGVQFPISY